MEHSSAFMDLLNSVFKAGDEHLAAAVHAAALPQQRKMLERIIFSSARQRRRFAAAIYTPASVLEALAADSDPKVRIKVARHPSSPAETLSKLAREDGSPEVLLAIAAHGNAETELLAGFPASESAEIRLGLCGNKNTPLAKLQEMLPQATMAALLAALR